MADEKVALELPSNEQQPQKKSHARRNVIVLAMILFFLNYTNTQNSMITISPKQLCTQSEELSPNKHSGTWKQLVADYSTPQFKDRAVDWLSSAVRVPTESYDSMGPVGEDKRWDTFYAFHDYLASNFTAVHEHLSLNKVNTHGLVYEWTGSDEQVKPILLAAHQDVVPVHPSTVDEWTHPPYSGYFDGTRVWGRGSSDDKSGLIGILSAVTGLIEKGYKPSRTIVLAFGFDEESSGLQGAGELSKYLEAKYGKDGFAFIIDEGAGYGDNLGAVIATPGVAEKGYFDLEVSVHGVGGHSSIPPPHTAIGILSALLVQYEAHPPAVSLTTEGVIFETLECLAAHAPDLPKKIQTSIAKAKKSRSARKAVEKYFFENRAFKSLVSTTQAIDIINGGVKINALPEIVKAQINHRIALQSSVEAVKKRSVETLKPLVDRFNLSFTAFGDEIASTKSGYSLNLGQTFHRGLEPAPVTPTDAAPYKLLSGTIQSTYNTKRAGEVDIKPVIVAPGIMSGNTDTRYYWDLSRHIFRYNHGRTPSTGLPGGIHTINENLNIDAFLEQILFFTTLILNADEAQL